MERFRVWKREFGLTCTWSVSTDHDGVKAMLLLRLIDGYRRDLGPIARAA